jgi:hypothetical protein
MIYLEMYFERNRYAPTSSRVPLLRKPGPPRSHWRKRKAL